MAPSLGETLTDLRFLDRFADMTASPVDWSTPLSKDDRDDLQRSLATLSVVITNLLVTTATVAKLEPESEWALALAEHAANVGQRMLPLMDHLQRFMR